MVFSIESIIIKIMDHFLKLMEVVCLIHSSFKPNEPKTRDLEKVRARGCFRKAQLLVNYKGRTALYTTKQRNLRLEKLFKLKNGKEMNIQFLTKFFKKR
jgi:hypothetical protein